MKTARTGLLVMTASILSACASQPWVMLDGSHSLDADPNSYNVLIRGVDNQMYPGNGNIKKVEPGFHNVYLLSTKPDRKGQLTDQYMPIFTKPCTTYYLAAQHESDLRYDNKRWQPVIVREEPIPTCENLTAKNADSSGSTVSPAGDSDR